MTTMRNDAISDAATEWLVRLRDEDSSESDRNEFQVWLGSDPRHLEAWSELQRMWNGMDSLAGSSAALPADSSTDPVGSSATFAGTTTRLPPPAPSLSSMRSTTPATLSAPIGPWTLTPRMAQPHARPDRFRVGPVHSGARQVRLTSPVSRTVLARNWISARRPLRGKVGLITVAASIICLIAAAVAWLALPASSFYPSADFRTGRGELQAVSLPDGSRVFLDAATALSFEFTEHERHVKLAAGRAFFQVSPDARRPFTVMANDGKVQALGTAFDVDVVGKRVAVAVSQGHVRVSSRAGEADLTVGQTLHYGMTTLGNIEPVDGADIAAWRANRLVFQDEPLAEVLSDLQRYRKGRILVMDAAVAARPVTGVFDTRHPDEALETITRLLPVRMIHIFGALTLVLPAAE